MLLGCWAADNEQRNSSPPRHRARTGPSLVAIGLISGSFNNHNASVVAGQSSAGDYPATAEEPRHGVPVLIAIAISAPHPMYIVGPSTAEQRRAG